jgi:hypothetical protein
MASNEPKLPAKMHGVGNAGHKPAHVQPVRRDPMPKSAPTNPGPSVVKRRTSPLPTTRGTKTIR